MSYTRKKKSWQSIKYRIKMVFNRPVLPVSSYPVHNGLTSSAPKAPVRAPANISSYNVTLNSVVLEWLPIMEEDIKGFLLGYTIHYMEYHPRGTEISKHHSSSINPFTLVVLSNPGVGNPGPQGALPCRCAQLIRR